MTTLYRRQRNVKARLRFNPLLIPAVLFALLLSGCFETTKPPALHITMPQLSIDQRLLESTQPLPLLASGQEQDVIANYSGVLAVHLQCTAREIALQNFLKQIATDYGKITEDVMRQVEEYNERLQ